MHISEGVLSPTILATGAVLSALGTGLALRRLKNKDIPKVAVVSSAFFAASMIHVPLGPASAHLVLNGLMGLLLGWSIFPSILIALLLQAVLFQFGGLTTLGVNTFSMAFPGLLSSFLFKELTKKGRKISFLAGFLCGFLSLLIAAFFMGLALIETERGFSGVALTLILTHIPISLVEGIITGFVILYLKRVKPEVLE